MLTAGLRSLRQRLQASDAEETCTTFVQGPPSLEALSVIWDTPALVHVDSYSVLLFCSAHQRLPTPNLFLQVRNEDVSTALLLASAQLLRLCLHQQQRHPPQLSGPAVQTQTALDHFASNIVVNRAKYLHQQLDSSIRHRANATLHLLSTIASRGEGLAAHLVKTLNLSLPAFVKLAHPPK